MRGENAALPIGNELSRKLANAGFVGACLVVSLHVSQHLNAGGFAGRIMPYFAERGLGNCAVPFFFMTSGFLIAGHMESKGWWQSECRKRVHTLLVPYLFWNIFYWCYMHCLKIALGLAGIAFATDLGWRLNLGLNPCALPQHSHLWFVRALMFATLVSPLFLVLRQRILGACSLILFAVFCEYAAFHFAAGCNEWSRLFAIQGWFRGLSFFSIGVYLRFNPIRVGCLRIIHAIEGRWWAVALALLPWICGAFASKHGFEMIVRALHLPILLTSIFFLFEAVPSMSWSKWLVSCAFPIYLIHGAVLVLFAALIRFLGLREYLSRCSLVFYLAYWGAVLGVSIVAALLFRKAKWLAALAFGGR